VRSKLEDRENVKAFLHNELDSPHIEYVFVPYSSNPTVLDVHMKHLCNIENKHCNRNLSRARSHVRQYMLFSECYDVMRELESRRGGVKFDSIVRIREDMMILDAINWKKISRMMKEEDEGNEGILIVPDYDTFRGYNDKIAFLNRKAAKSYLQMPFKWYYSYPDKIWTNETLFGSGGVMSPELILRRFADLGMLDVRKVPPFVLAAKTAGFDATTGNYFYRSEDQCWLGNYPLFQYVPLS